MNNMTYFFKLDWETQEYSAILNISPFYMSDLHLNVNPQTPWTFLGLDKMFKSFEFQV